MSGGTPATCNGIFTASVGVAAPTTSIKFTCPDPGSIDANTGICTTTTGGDNSGRPIKAISWLAGVATVQTWGAHNLTVGSSCRISNVTVATGFNTTVAQFAATITAADTFTYPLVSDPGGGAANISASAAAHRDSKANVNIVSESTRLLKQNVNEGDTYNMSDGAKLGGGAAAMGDYVQGGSSGRYKVRWTNTGWKRVG